jgi:hypothetical protein
MIVKTHFGEGDYQDMENAIRMLLNLPQYATKDESALHKPITPETYLGFERGDRNDHVVLQGSWTIKNDCVQSESNNSEIILNFTANHVYLVMKSDRPQLITILLDGKTVPEKYWTRDSNKEGKILVHEPRMYDMLDLKDDYDKHTLTLQCQEGINAYVFTFG